MSNSWESAGLLQSAAALFMPFCDGGKEK